MHPILFTIGPLTLYTYGAMLVAAFLMGTWLSGHVARTLPPKLVAISDEQLVDFTCVSLLGGIIGGRLLYVALQWPLFTRSPLEIFALWHGGLVWYGGFAGGLVAGWWYVRAKRLDWWRVLDQSIPFLALGHAVGRVGCFFNGCCYGKPWHGWFAVVFPGHPGPVLPTQLFEALGLCFLYIGLRAAQQPAVLRRPGRVFGMYLIGYGLLRFGLEFTRGDQSVWWLGLTLQQVLSLVLIVGGALLQGKSQKEKVKTTI